MISFLPPEDRIPQLPDIQSITEKIARDYLKSVDDRLVDALTTLFGKVPPPEELSAHCVCIVDKDHVRHYCWFDVKPGIGESVDLSKAFLTVKPPEIFNPEKQ